MTTNLSLDSDLLSEKNLLGLLLSFGNTNDREQDLSNFCKSLYKNLNLKSLSFIPSSPEIPYQHQPDNFNHARPKYHTVREVLGQEKWKTINQNESSNSSKKFIKANHSYFIVSLLNSGVIVLEGTEHDHVFESKTLQLIIDKFLNTYQLLSEQEQLQTIEYKYKILVQENNLGMAYIKNKKFLDVNKSFLEFSGYDREEIIDIDFSKIYDLQTQNLINDLLKTFTSRSKKNISFDGVLISKKGESKTFKCSSQALYNGQKEYIGSLNTFVDTTQETAATRNVQDSKHLITSLFDHVATGLIMLENNKIVKSNNYISDILGFTQDELKEKQLHELVHESHHNIFDLNQEEKYKKKIPQKIIPFKTKSENEVLLVTQFIHINNDQNTAQTIVNFVDVTEVEIAKKELLSKETMLNTILENSTQNILVLDKNHTILHFNKGSKRGFLRNFGIELKLGDHLFENNKGKIDKSYEKLLNKAFKGQEISFDYTSKNEDGSNDLYSVVTFKPLLDPNNNIIGIISLTKDVTELILQNKIIEKRESTLKAIIDASADGIYAVDKNMDVIFLNEQAKRDFKSYINVDLGIGDNLYDRIESTKVDKWREVYYNRVLGGESFEVNPVMYNQLYDKEYYVENRYTPVKDNDGNIFAALEISRNVTDLRNKERDLAEKESELRSVLEKTPTGITKISLDGTINFITKKTSSILSTKKEDIIGKNIMSFIHDSDRERIFEDIALLLKGENEINSTYRLLHPEKEEFYIHGVASVMVDQNEEPQEFLIAFNDITEKIIAKDLLTKSENRYKSLLDGSPAGLAQVDQQGNFIFVSKKGAEILGDPMDDVLNKNFYHYIDDKYQNYVSENLNKLTKPNELIDFRVKGKGSNGIVFYLDGTATLLQDTFTKKYSTLFIFNDVTSRVLAEKELKIYNSKLEEKNAIYKALIDNSFDGIDIIELTQPSDKNPTSSFESEVLIRNEKMNEYFNYSRSSLISDYEILKISPDIQANGEKTESKFKNILHNLIENKFYISEWRINATGINEDYKLSAKLVSLKNKVLLIRNLSKITKTKLQQQIIKNQLSTLSKKNIELKKYIESNLQLENFAYIASHDLKAPLRTVTSFSFLLKQAAYEQLDKKSQGYLDIVLRSSTNMQLLIDDLLEFSRVGTQQVKIKEINLGPMIKRILLDLDTNIQESGAQIHINNMPETIFADESMMIQVFQNLINNALKFRNKDQKPIVDINTSESDAHWIFKIKDNGIGIKQESIEKIFGIFEKLHSNDIYEGTGLGLSICKKIIEIHNGEISVESEINKGSCFTFSISKNIVPKIDH